MRSKIIILLVLLLIPSLCFSQLPSADIDLDFGVILSGVPRIVSKHTAGKAAEFTVSGTAGAEIQIDFILPSYMYSGTSTMRLVFTSTDCAMDSSAAPDQSNPIYNDLNPWRTITYGLGSSGLSIWLGALAMPDPNQASGNYTAPLTIQILYTGN